MENFHGIAVQNLDQLSRKGKNRSNTKKNKKKNEKGDLFHFLSLKIYAIRSRAQQVKPGQGHPQTFPQISVDNLDKEKKYEKSSCCKSGLSQQDGRGPFPGGAFASFP
jgi:hypothetical protein